MQQAHRDPSDCREGFDAPPSNTEVIEPAVAANRVTDIDVDPAVAAALISNHLSMLTSPTWAMRRSASARAIRGTGQTLQWLATDTADEAAPPPKPSRKRRSKTAQEPAQPEAAAEESVAVPTANNDTDNGEPRRGWWQRTFG